MAREHTQVLRNLALRVFDDAGRPLRRIHARRHVYSDQDGRGHRLSTNMERVLIITTQGTDANAPIDLEDVENLIFAAPRQPGRLDEIDVYLIPTKRIAEDARQDHRHFLEQRTTKGHNTTWQQRFDTTDNLCGGYSSKYAGFLIATVTESCLQAARSVEATGAGRR
ncbi:MAG TPA: hypothetical protein VFZ01_04790 [Geminicoccaceae bacterium]